MKKSLQPATVLCSVFLVLLLPVLAGCGGKTSLEGVSIPRLYVETRGGGGGYGGSGSELLRLPLSGTVVPVEKEPVVNEFGITNVELVKVDLGLALLIQLSPEAARKLYRVSVSRMGGRIVLTVNGNPVGARRIDSAISDGNLFTFVEIPDEALEALVVDLKASIIKLQTKLAEGR